MKGLIVGSGFSISQCDQWDTSSHIVVACNNAWKKVRWDRFCCASDYVSKYDPAVGFPDKTSLIPGHNYYDQDHMNGVVSRYRGWFEVGQSIIVAAAYSLIDEFKDSLTTVGFIGCDMVYGDGKTTAYYGKGIDFQRVRGDGKFRADPFHMAREEKTFKQSQELMHRLIAEGKDIEELSDIEVIHHFYNRFAVTAKQQYGIDVVNYSTYEDSVLPFPKVPYSS